SSPAKKGALLEVLGLRQTMAWPNLRYTGLAALASLAWAAPTPTPITVIPFAARAGAPQAWLSKGLSDIFIRHLAEIPSLAVVEREQLQEFIKEMDLGQAPLFDQAQALRVGRVARVQQVVYGSY